MGDKLKIFNKVTGKYNKVIGKVAINHMLRKSPQILSKTWQSIYNSKQARKFPTYQDGGCKKGKNVQETFFVKEKM